MSLDVMNLLVVLLAALSGGVIARRFGYPAILGELMAGIVLGPPLLGLLQPDDALAVERGKQRHLADWRKRRGTEKDED